MKLENKKIIDKSREDDRGFKWKDYPQTEVWLSHRGEKRQVSINIFYSGKGSKKLNSCFLVLIHVNRNVVCRLSSLESPEVCFMKNPSCYHPENKIYEVWVGAQESDL